MYIGFHAAMVVCFKYADLHLGNFRWEAAGAMQFFLMFMLIFYNGHCYERYLDFYRSCMDVLRSSIFFIQELIISVPYDEVEKHRQVASRYILATVYLFYMGVTGGAAKGLEWHELKRKGLLTKDEAHMLSEYPGRVTLTLTSWAMQVVLKALDKDVFWEDQKPHIAHVHNRLNVHMIAIIRSSNRVCYLLAQPIPFLYFHLMNSILVVNFFVLGVAFAIFKTWMTLAAYGFAVLVYTGMRQVSIDLSEPFEQDASDFPVHQFLDYAFDHSVGLLEAFSHPDAYDVVMNSISSTSAFTNEELTRSATTQVQYNYGRTKTNPFVWHKPMPFQQLGETKKKHLKRALTHMLVDMGTLRDAQNDLTGHHEDTRGELLKERRQAAHEVKKELEAAQTYLKELKATAAAAVLGELPEEQPEENPFGPAGREQAGPPAILGPDGIAPIPASTLAALEGDASAKEPEADSRRGSKSGSRRGSKIVNGAGGQEPDPDSPDSHIAMNVRPGEGLSSDEELPEGTLLSFDEALLRVRANMAKSVAANPPAVRKRRPVPP
jgi:predicted membrane chloride channel (bestrophin family)